MEKKNTAPDWYGSKGNIWRLHFIEKNPPVRIPAAKEDDWEPFLMVRIETASIENQGKQCLFCCKESWNHLVAVG